MKICVTGGAGFIGSHVAEAYLSAGADVVVVDDLSSGSRENVPAGATLVELDIRDRKGVMRLFEEKRFSIVNHHAAQMSVTESVRDPLFDAQVNVVGLVNLLDASVKTEARKFIFISSALVLGYRKLNICEENPGESACHLPYVRSKKKTEEKLLSMHSRDGLPVVILRPADVFGPNDRVTCIHILKGIEGGVPVIVGGGKWIFPFCYVDNLCQAIYLACNSTNSEGQTYTVTNGSDVTWKEFLSFFQKKLNKKQWIYIPAFLPHMVAFGMKIIKAIIPNYKPSLTDYRAKRVTSHTNYDISKTIKELNYVPENDMDKQFCKIVDWYLAEKAAGHIR